MKFIILLIILFLIPLIQADTTFFDNPNDFFIMNSLATGGMTGEITTGTTGGGGCMYGWNCTNWSRCSFFGKQTRNCINIGTCPDNYKTPTTEQNCTSSFEGEIIWRETFDKNKIFIYFFIVILVISFVIFYIKKNYFKS